MGGGIAALIAAVGLFGMAAFNTSMRAHEIGIRKSFGASQWRILRLLVFQFLRPVLVGNCLAWPIAWWVLDGWFRRFGDRIAISPLFFVTGTAVSMLIAVASVAGIAWSAAMAAPGSAMRQD
jgi:putative ABC transport system permease protein